MTPREFAGPLAGVTVIEFAAIGPAPFCGMMFADMGANVVLIDRKETNADALTSDSGENSRRFEICHRNKRSIAIDLKRQAGAALVLSLVEKADILLEGFRPGVMERLGLGPDTCFERNPRLVFGRMTGWGQYGPLAKAAGHEPNYLAISGTHHYARHGGVPWSPMTMAGDVGAGSTLLAWGCLSALFEARRTGRGRIVDAAITDGAAYNSALLLMLRNAGQIAAGAGDSWVDGAAPWSDVFVCADGRYIALCALEPKFYADLVEKLSLAEDPDFSSQWRKSAWKPMRQKLSDIFKGRTRDEWAAHFDESDACAAPVLTFDEAREHPHNKARGVYVDAPGGFQPATAPKLEGHDNNFNPPPAIGEQTEEILDKFNISIELRSMIASAGIA